MASTSFQDWSEIVIGGARKKEAREVNAGKTVFKKIVTDEDGNLVDPVVKPMAHNVRLNLQKARALKNWKQTDLARAISTPVNMINDFESGKAHPNQTVLNKMENALGVYLAGNKALEKIPRGKNLK
jgi:putative transcription factor